MQPGLRVVVLYIMAILRTQMYCFPYVIIKSWILVMSHLHGGGGGAAGGTGGGDRALCKLCFLAPPDMSLCWHVHPTLA